MSTDSLHHLIGWNVGKATGQFTENAPIGVNVPNASTPPCVDFG
jgi:hypothetical protein